MTVWPHLSVRAAASRRPATSLLPPGGKGTRSFTVLVGYDCAEAAVAIPATASANTSCKQRRWNTALLPGHWSAVFLMGRIPSTAGNVNRIVHELKREVGHGGAAHQPGQGADEGRRGGAGHEYPPRALGRYRPHRQGDRPRLHLHRCPALDLLARDDRAYRSHLAR